MSHTFSTFSYSLSACCLLLLLMIIKAKLSFRIYVHISINNCLVFTLIVDIRFFFYKIKKKIQLYLHPLILCFCYRIILVTYCTTEEETGLYDGEFKSESCLFPGILHVICLNYNCIKNLQLHCMFVHELLQFR